MNKDQVKGSLKEAAGKVQEKTGELTGNKSQELKGAARQVEGNVQKTYGDAKEAAKDSGRATLRWLCRKSPTRESESADFVAQQFPRPCVHWCDRAAKRKRVLDLSHNFLLTARRDP